MNGGFKNHFVGWMSAKDVIEFFEGPLDLMSLSILARTAMLCRLSNLFGYGIPHLLTTADMGHRQLWRTHGKTQDSSASVGMTDVSTNNFSQHYSMTANVTGKRDLQCAVLTGRLSTRK